MAGRTHAYQQRAHATEAARYALVSARGELDAAALEAVDYAVERAGAVCPRVVLDFTEVTHLDYRGARLLLERRRALQRAGGDLTVVAPARYVANIVRAAAGRDLEVCRTLEEGAALMGVEVRAAARPLRR
jgi:anti-anti-sigma factor